MSEYLDETSLAASWVVANNDMNRERRFIGGNSYTKDLSFGLPSFLRGLLQTQEHIRWLDMCCGSGMALLEAARMFAEEGVGERISMTGVDLVDYFAPIPPDLTNPPTFVVASLQDWEPTHPCDLITCVHGFHYVGDKLGLIAKAASWLKPNGRMIGHLDRANVRSHKGKSMARRLTTEFARHGIYYAARYRILTIVGHKDISFPFVYLGAKDDAGPNYTGQPAVHSFYQVESK